MEKVDVETWFELKDGVPTMTPSNVLTARPVPTVPVSTVATIPMDPVTVPPDVFRITTLSGPCPVRKTPAPCACCFEMLIPTATPDATDNVGVVVPPDADAAGAAIAAAITGIDQAAPLTILRRLRPPSSLLVTSAFRTSDNFAPTYFSAGASPDGPAACYHRVFAGCDHSSQRRQRFTQPFCKIRSRFPESAELRISGSPP